MDELAVLKGFVLVIGLSVLKTPSTAVLFSACRDSIGTSGYRPFQGIRCNLCFCTYVVIFVERTEPEVK